MIANLRDSAFDSISRCLARALLWALAGVAAAALILIALLAGSGILAW